MHFSLIVLTNGECILYRKGMKVQSAQRSDILLQNVYVPFLIRLTNYYTL